MAAARTLNLRSATCSSTRAASTMRFAASNPQRRSTRLPICTGETRGFTPGAESRLPRVLDFLTIRLDQLVEEIENAHPCILLPRPIVVALLTGMLARACGKPADATAPAGAVQVAAGWPAFVESFIEARFKADPYFAVQAGRHEFDGQMPDWSRAAIDAEVSDLRKFAERARQAKSGLADRRAAIRTRVPAVGGGFAALLARRTPKRHSAIRPGTSKSWIRRCISRANTRRCQNASRLSGYARAVPASRREYPRQSAHTVAESVHRPRRRGLRRIRHVLPQRDAGHLRASLRMRS